MTTQASLAGWMRYLSGMIPGQPDAGAQDFLTRLRQYDPSATIVMDTNNTGESAGTPGYHFQFDPAKLPAPVQQSAALNGFPIVGGAHEVTGANGFNITDPKQVFEDPVYGKWTPNANVTQSSSLLDKIGPLIPLALMGGAGLGLLGPAGGAAGGAAAGTGGLTLGDLGGASTSLAEGGADTAVGGWDSLTGSEFGGQFGPNGLIPGEGNAASALAGTVPDAALGDMVNGGLGDYSPGNTYGGTFNPDGTIAEGTPGFDPASGTAVTPGGPGDSIGSLPGVTGGAGGSGLSLGDLAKMAGGIPGLATILGGIASAVLGKNATSKATDQVLAGIQSAGDQAKQLLGNTQSMYQPYMQSGQTGMDALAKLLNQPGLAGNFKPIPNVYLSQNYKPLGAGRGLAAPPNVTLGQIGR